MSNVWPTRIILEHMVCDTILLEERRKHEPHTLLDKLYPHEAVTPAVAIENTQFLIEDGYNPFKIYNVVQLYLNAYMREEDKLKKERKNRRKAIMGGAVVVAGAVGLYSGSVLIASVLGLTGAGLTEGVDIMRGCRINKQYRLIEILGAVNGYLEEMFNIHVPQKPTEKFKEWGCHKSKVQINNYSIGGKPMFCVQKLEVYHYQDRNNRLIIPFINGEMLPNQIKVSESMVDLPVFVSERRIRAFAAEVYPHVHFYSRGEELVSLH